MRKSRKVFDKLLVDMPAARTQAPTLRIIRDLKQNTSYYGVRCACGRSLALCEDIFTGNDDEDVLLAGGPVAVKCECGALTKAQFLKKLKIPRTPHRRSRNRAL